jgi:hypothetical protein
MNVVFCNGTHFPARCTPVPVCLIEKSNIQHQLANSPMAGSSNPLEAIGYIIWISFLWSAKPTALLDYASGHVMGSASCNPAEG